MWSSDQLALVFSRKIDKKGLGGSYLCHTLAALNCVMLLLREDSGCFVRRILISLIKCMSGRSPVLIQRSLNQQLDPPPFHLFCLCSTYDLNKQTARIDAFIPICGVCLFQAEKADGFVNLPDFTVEKASECKKKQ